ncbi:MAG: hypothetical protein ACNYPD_01630 [Candidatus Halichondribacter symbioticus]
MAVKKGNKPKQGKVLPPEKPLPSNISKTEMLTIIANIPEQTHLTLEVLEKHDPGFIKRMNKRMEEEAEISRPARFRFGEIMAYTGLAVKTIIALIICPLLMYLVITSDTGAKFWLIIALTVLFAVSQSGNSGFAEITRALAQWITKGIKGNNRDD